MRNWEITNTGSLSARRKSWDAFFADRSWTGVNVTIPYKRAAMKYCDVISERALRIGCVNTVVREADGLVHGYNTDYDGFLGLVNRAGIFPAARRR